MSKEKSIPKKDVDFNIAQNIIATTASENSRRWGLDEAWLSAELLPKKDEWDSAWAAYENPATRTPEITFVKTENRKEYEKPLRILIKNLQSNVHVTPEDLISMGIALPNPSRTPAPVATEAPDIDVDTSVIGRLSIHFFERGSRHKKGKPAGQHGAEIRWLLSDTPPTRWDDLTHSEIDTNSPFTLSFEYDQRGKTVYFALRWENTRGEKGPWSEILSAIIP
ncbi:MAG: hypothetical protein LBH30_00595 [Prevotellaceae bacterium]|jgi:hypothetical protein|nr:hypothetical protein [Prevotellaceae bacterium]